MDHACHRCQQPVEDGVPFCPQCGAPQIRVAAPENEIALSPGAALTVDSDGVALRESQSAATIPVSLPVQWPRALPMCALAAAISALLMVLGLIVPLLAASGAGFLAVIFYRRGNPFVLVKAATGARLGAVSGVFCFGMSAAFEAVALVVMHRGALLREKMLEAIQQAAARTADPQAQAMMDYFRSPAGLAIMMVFVLLFAFLALVMLASLGGALGGALVGGKPRA